MCAARAQRADECQRPGQRLTQHWDVELRIVREHHNGRGGIGVCRGQIAVRPVHHHRVRCGEALRSREDRPCVAHRHVVAEETPDLGDRGGVVDRAEHQQARWRHPGLGERPALGAEQHRHRMTVHRGLKGRTQRRAVPLHQHVQRTAAGEADRERRVVGVAERGQLRLTGLQHRARQVVDLGLHAAAGHAADHLAGRADRHRRADRAGRAAAHGHHRGDRETVPRQQRRCQVTHRTSLGRRGSAGWPPGRTSPRHLPVIRSTPKYTANIRARPVISQPGQRPLQMRSTTYDTRPAPMPLVIE